MRADRGEENGDVSEAGEGSLSDSGVHPLICFLSPHRRRLKKYILRG
jgi:hypothetical protein